ncbi:hypothetical protein PSH84_19075 [Pseudomonas beijingensis]|uniref:hypothetical protein n=1 Tax=Pseudomonas beijingensis TaxID=2954101 RepID=UPI0027355E2D|nr:hypothetical protein [Pseudomonas sp. FP830]WLI43675.1 hypothetical protein PSH84_19075 [Pseudomonas sp. FP830]
MNSALNELEHVSLGVMAQVLLHTGALPLQVWRSAVQINHALGTAPRHAWIVRRWLAALTRRRCAGRRRRTPRLARHATHSRDRKLARAVRRTRLPGQHGAPAQPGH